METTPNNHATNVLDVPVDCGNWTDLQAKLATHCGDSLSRLDTDIAAGLEKLEEKFKSYITHSSFKRSMHRRKSA